MSPTILAWLNAIQVHIRYTGNCEQTSCQMVDNTSTEFKEGHSERKRNRKSQIS